MKQIQLVQIGVGLIGGSTIQQVLHHRAMWRDRFGIDLGYAAVIASDGALLASERVFNDRDLQAILTARKSRTPLSDIATSVSAKAVSGASAIQDVAAGGAFITADTAAGDATAAISEQALAHGGGVVFSNKAPLALSATGSASKAIWGHAGANGLARYETSCGAGLPVISTLRSLLDTGDEVIEITGSLSGTFGAIFSDVVGGKRFSEAVRSAKERGYTEPDPRDDLSGLDVARKALILARTLGRTLDLSDIEIESLVPTALASVSVPEYLERVSEQDAEMADRARQAAASRATLKYVAKVAPTGRISVGIQAIPRSTVLGALQGPENIISFRTKRYDAYPMNITGPGAGAEVTAAGVVADILALAVGPLFAKSETEFRVTARPARTGDALDAIIAGLAPDSYYQSPGGRRFLIAAALLAGVEPGCRVLDVACGIGPAAVDMAEAFGCRVSAFDNFAPYLQFGRQLANSREVGKQVTFRELDGEQPLSAFEPGSFDVVLGMGGGLSDSLPGGLASGFRAAAQWLVPNGVLIAGDLVSPVPPSDMMRIVFGESLRSEASFLTALTSSGFEVIFASRAARADWDTMRAAMDRLRERSLDLGPPDEQNRSRLTDAAQDHPEIAYLNVVARKR